MKQYHSVLFVIVCFKFLYTETTKFEDYSWRDYEGDIPQDAFSIRQDKTPIYVGQVLFQEKIIPGIIKEYDGVIYFEYFDVEYSTDLNVKIMCTTQPSKFQWTPVNNTDVLTLPSQSLIKGGFEPKCQTYIGRVEINGRFLPGKVMCCTKDIVKNCYGLYTTYNGKGSLHRSFQILQYKENVQSTPSTEIMNDMSNAPN